MRVTQTLVVAGVLLAAASCSTDSGEADEITSTGFSYTGTMSHAGQVLDMWP